jgi:hypothetical protein
MSKRPYEVPLGDPYYAPINTEYERVGDDEEIEAGGTETFPRPFLTMCCDITPLDAHILFYIHFYIIFSHPDQNLTDFSPPCFSCPHAAESGENSFGGTIFTIINSIVGGGVVALPFVMNQAGLALGTEKV